MTRLTSNISVWWQALVRPEEAARLVLDDSAQPGFIRFLLATVAALYGFYGPSMGLFRGYYPALASGLKLPFLFILTLLICFPPFYAINCLYGPHLRFRQCLRLMLIATSANAAALASYALVSYFLTLTSTKQDYNFLVMNHVAIFGLAGIASLMVIVLVFRATHKRLGRPIRPLVVLAWGGLYAFVGTQMAWTLRPWIGDWSVTYVFLRRHGGSFIESVWYIIFG
ncbi:MAG: hypothetical protein NTX50_12750 [Candidatus Sumerlaeota bacterium]|nr:hypothetical protein [Candidatus Sumerlaeota bacterium]